MWLKHATAAATTAVTGSNRLINYGPSVLKQNQPRGLLLSARGALFTTTAACQRFKYPPRPKPPPDNEITEVYLKGSGPGGQKINKTSSAVQVKHLPTGIVIKCQETRSRSQNRKIARERLAEKIDESINGANSRSAVVARMLAKKKADALKRSRKKYLKDVNKAKACEGEEKNDAEQEDPQNDVPPESPATRSRKKDEPAP